MTLKINVLGTEYTVNWFNYSDLPIFEKRSIGGYSDDVAHEIAICNMKTHPGFEEESEEWCKTLEKRILRHEIVHAFLSESGLQDSALQCEQAWSKNEEMVDWIALQAPKLIKVFEEAGCL